MTHVNNYADEMYHVGYLVDDINVAMAEMGESMGLTWTAIVERPEQSFYTVDGGYETCVLKFAYTTNGPQRIELIEAVPGTPWDHFGRPGIHHSGVWADVADLTNQLISEGWTLAGSQKTAEEGYGNWTYVRSPSGFLLEPVNRAARPRMERWFAGEDVM